MSRILGTENSIIVSNNKLYCFEQDNSPFNIVIDSGVVNNTALQAPILIDCFNISICKKWIAVCYKKEIHLYYNCEFQSSAAIVKCAARLLFFNTKKIILVADRSGGVCFYDFTDKTIKKSGETMGHNSMLSDALISSNDQYILTSDRDEKIRVTCYPNVYNIQSYCLGHEQFVSSISFLPSDESILVSASGDGTVRLWDYQIGNQLQVYKEPSKEKSIVKAVCIPRKQEDLIIAQFFKSDELSILSVTGTKQQVLNVELLTRVTICKLIDFSQFKTAIICLAKENPKLQLLKLTEENEEQTKEFVCKAAEHLQDTELTCNVETLNIMFKREYDNILEYQERKRTRISNKLSKLK